MEAEDDFLTQLSDQAAGAALLSASLRWGLEGALKNQEDLPELAVKLQETLERTLTLIEARRKRLRADLALE